MNNRVTSEDLGTSADDMYLSQVGRTLSQSDIDHNNRRVWAELDHQFAQYRMVRRMREAFIAKARMCGVWAVARQLFKQGQPLVFTMWVLHPLLVELNDKRSTAA